MADRMLLATRKGLIQLARKNGGWSIARTSFPGIAVTAALHDARDGTPSSEQHCERRFSERSNACAET